MNNKIAVVMATYNGERYINEQIDSILKCNLYDEVVSEFIISDDESTDNTLEICRSYLLKNKKLNVFNNSKKGVVNNFVNGITKSNADYIVLSDQDDIWEKNKLEVLYNKINEAEQCYGKNTPLIVFSDSSVVDKKLQIISSSFFEYTKANPYDFKLEKLLVKNFIQGCVMIFNRALLNKIKFETKESWIMHDWWLLLNAAHYGKILFSDKKLIKYRLHDSNVMGATNKNIINKLRTSFYLNKKFRKEGREIIMQSFEFLNNIDEKEKIHTIPMLMFRYENTLFRKIMVMINFFYFRKEISLISR